MGKGASKGAASAGASARNFARRASDTALGIDSILDQKIREQAAFLARPPYAALFKIVITWPDRNYRSSEGPTALEKMVCASARILCRCIT